MWIDSRDSIETHLLVYVLAFEVQARVWQVLLHTFIGKLVIKQDDWLMF